MVGSQESSEKNAGYQLNNLNSWLSCLISVVRGRVLILTNISIFVYSSTFVNYGSPGDPSSRFTSKVMPLGSALVRASENLASLIAKLAVPKS